jgi:glycosyltransferase involved in cell wall biosynthesis
MNAKLVLCQNSKIFLQEQYGVESLKIPNFVEQDKVIASSKELRTRVERVCFVGVVSQGKGAKELYAVARQLPDICFELIGEVSPDVIGWQKPDNVKLFGSIPNRQVLQRLDGADVFLFPSHTEGCSMALMEAMARGLPCIATDGGANADMLGCGCGIVVAKHDVDAMVAAICTLQDPQLRKTVSQNAVEKVRQDYTDKNVDKIISVIRTLEKK